MLLLPIFHPFILAQTIISTSAGHSAPSFQSLLSDRYFPSAQNTGIVIPVFKEPESSLTGRYQLPAQSAFSISYFQNHTGVCQAVSEEKLPWPGLLTYVLQNNKTTTAGGFLQAMTYQEKHFFGVLDFCTKVTVVVGFTLWTTASKNLLHFHYANIIQVHLKMFRGLYTTQR